MRLRSRSTKTLAYMLAIFAEVCGSDHLTATPMIDVPVTGLMATCPASWVVVMPSPSRLTTSRATGVSCSSSEYVSGCLLYTSDAADEEDSVDLGGRRIIKKK